MTVNDRIRLLRKEQGLTMQKFCDRIAIKTSSLSQIETGKNNPSDQTIRSISREFGVSEEWLRTGAGGDEAMHNPRRGQDDIADLIQRHNLPKEAYVFIREYVDLPEKSQRAVIEYVQRVASRLHTPAPTEAKNVHDYTQEEAQDYLASEFAMREGAGQSDSGAGSSGTAVG